MTIAIAIIVGLVTGVIVGSIARLLLPGKQRIPLWLTAILGLIGSNIGNLAASALHVAHTSGVDWTRHILQVLVAGILVAIVAPLFGKKKSAA